jgi:cytochrome P450
MRADRSTSRLPPGPKGWLFVGNLLDFRRDPIRFLQTLASDYGDIASFRLGSQFAVQLNHPDLIRDVLVTHSKNFTKTRGLNRARTVIGNGLLTSEGDFHRRQRRLCQPSMNPQRVSAYGSAMVQCASDMCARWAPGDEVDVGAAMLEVTLGIAGRTLFASDIRSEAKEIGDAMTVVFEYFNWLMLPMAAWTRRLPLRRHRRFREARDLLDRTVYRIIRERRSTGQDHGDLLSMLLLAKDPEGAGGSMSDEQVRDEAMTMFLAGHETVATALTWTLYLLARHPDIQSQLHSELDKTLGGRQPTADDLPRLKHAEMVFAESMRVFPPVWTLTRQAIQDYEVGEYVLPAGTVVGLSQYVMHHDPRFFERPEEFDPSRWTPEQKAKRPKFSYFPFGGGPRLCIGESFAWMEGTLLLATIARQWKFQLPRGTESNVEFQPLITLRPKNRVRLLVERRNAQEKSAGASGFHNSDAETLANR